MASASAYPGRVGDPRAVMDRLTAAQNEHDLEGMLACFQEDYRSEQPLFPSRAFQGIDQVRANWSALLDWYRDETDVGQVELHATEYGDGLYRSLGFVPSRFPAQRLRLSR